LCSLDPLTGELVALFHPRRADWTDHFLMRDDGFIEGITAQGRVTVSLLRINTLERQDERGRLMSLGEY
jgi:hypothetical protein